MMTNNKTPFEINVIDKWCEFESLNTRWNELLSKSDANNLFLTWEWLNCWRLSQNTTIEPIIIIIKDNSKVIGIAPLYLQKYKLCNFIDLFLLASQWEN